MKYVIYSATILLFACGMAMCASPFKQAHQANDIAFKAARDFYDEKCGKIAIECRDVGDTSCLPLSDCQHRREEVAKILVQVEYSILNARTAYRAGNAEDGDIQMAKTRELILGVLEQIEKGRK